MFILLVVSDIICKYWNEAVDFWAITLLIKGHSSSASSLEIGEGAPKEEKLSRQDNCKNSNSFIPTASFQDIMHRIRTTWHENGKYGSVYFLSGSFQMKRFLHKKSTEGFVGDRAQCLRDQGGTSMFHFLSGGSMSIESR